MQHKWSGGGLVPWQRVTQWRSVTVMGSSLHGPMYCAAVTHYSINWFSGRVLRGKLKHRHWHYTQDFWERTLFLSGISQCGSCPSGGTNMQSWCWLAEGWMAQNWSLRDKENQSIQFWFSWLGGLMAAKSLKHQSRLHNQCWNGPGTQR